MRTFKKNHYHLLSLDTSEKYFEPKTLGNIPFRILYMLKFTRYSTFKMSYFVCLRMILNYWFLFPNLPFCEVVLVLHSLHY